MNSYFGSKATSGLCQPIIAMMPPHDTCIETHLGDGAIMRRKPAALRNIAIDLDPKPPAAFECDYPVEKIHGCAHRFLSDYGYDRSERSALRPIMAVEAIEQIGIIPRYGGVVIHDCWQFYLCYDHCRHGLCGSHLLRELTFIVDSNGYRWASNMKRLLQEICVIVAKRESKWSFLARFTLTGYPLASSKHNL